MTTVHPRYHRAVPPQPVEGIEVALVLVLDVDDDVDVVQQRPAALAGAFAAGGLVAGLAHLLLDLVDDRVDLSLVGRRRDHEAVGDDQLIRDVDDDDIVGELRGRRARCDCRHVDGLGRGGQRVLARPVRAVESRLGDVLHDAVGHQVPQRAALRGAQPAVGGRDCQSAGFRRVTGRPRAAPSDSGDVLAAELVAGPADADEPRRGEQLVEVLPGQDGGQRVGAGDEVQSESGLSACRSRRVSLV